MNRVDTFWDGRDIYQDRNGMYYITLNGVVVSPAFASLKAAWEEAWKYRPKEEQTDEPQS